MLPDATDVHVYGGILLVTVGVGWVWLPGALIALGAMLYVLGLFLLEG